MGFGKNKKKVEEETIDKEDKEESIKEEVVSKEKPGEPVKKEGDIRLVTNDQLIHLKLDGLGEYIRDTTKYLEQLGDSFEKLQSTVEKGLED